jgi:peroxiredoxin-like protein
MDTIHKYRTLAWWTSGQTGLAKTDSAPNAIHFSAPPEFGGLDGRWTPEDLLLAALASCFTTTFRALAGYSKFEYIDLQVEVEGAVSKAESGYSFSEIILRPTVTIQAEENRDRALHLLQKTKAVCLVSRALATAPILESHVEIGNALSVAGSDGGRP